MERFTFCVEKVEAALIFVHRSWDLCKVNNGKPEQCVS